MIRLGAVVGLLISVSGLNAQNVDTLQVDVHGHTVALYISGAGPTVVLESGGGSSHRAWSAVVPALAKAAQVVAYDRPGYGLSEPCDSPRTAHRIARELREALRQAQLDGPYVLAGWSYGGAIARVFAGIHAAEVVGLVLVDPAMEDFYPRAALEAGDGYSLAEEEYFGKLYADSARLAEKREGFGYLSSMEQARDSDRLHSTPTTLLIAAGGINRSQDDPLSRIWVDELKKWAARRPNTTTVVVDSGHHIARERPAAVIEAILERLEDSEQ
jgi:pimeloyl-ACP methyl ester carboxylesterase